MKNSHLKLCDFCDLFNFVVFIGFASVMYVGNS